MPGDNKDKKEKKEDTSVNPEDDKVVDDASKKPGADTQDALTKVRPAPTGVDVHPLVLLSAVDHFTRFNSKVVVGRRVVGLLLGMYIKNKYKETSAESGAERGYSTSGGKKGSGPDPNAEILDINNSFAVPFDEDTKDNAVWFFDTNYADEMFRMFRKVMPKVKVVGWYSSGTEIQPNDLHIHLLVAQRFCPNPIYCVINTDPTKKGVPVLAYTTTEAKEGKGSTIQFRNILTNLGTVEAEDIGVEHLLRDLTDTTITTLSTRVQDRHLALLKLEILLETIEAYLLDVADGKLSLNHEILSAVQELVDLLPLVHQVKKSTSMLVATNDQLLTTFVASVSRCVMTLYEVILNRRGLARGLKESKEKKEIAKKKEEEVKAAQKKAKEEEKGKEKDSGAVEKKVNEEKKKE